MYLCFIDESGHVPSQRRARSVPNFIIAAMMVPEAQWPEMASEFNRAIREKRVEGEIKWRYFGPENDDRDNPMLHLSFEKRCQLRKKLLTIVTKRRSIRIVATRTRVAEAWSLRYIETKRDIYHYTYKQTVERLNYALQDVSRLTGETHRGILIADHRGADDDKYIRQYHASMTEKNSTFTSTFKHFVERVMLTDSAHSIGVQLVDLCAGALGRAYNADEVEWVDMLRGNIRNHPKKGIEGFGVVTWPKD